MKKLLISFLLLFYLGSVSGANIHVHYCGGKIKYISVFDTKEKRNCCGSKKKNKGCCRDKMATVKQADEHQSVHHLTVPDPVKCPDLFSFQSFNSSVYNIRADRKTFFYKPPIASIQAVYLLNNVLLI